MKTLDNNDNIGLMLEFPKDGRPLLANETYYWSSTFRNIITTHTKDTLPFPDAKMAIRDGDNCTGVTFFKNTGKRSEAVAHSLCIKDGMKIPRRDIVALQAAIDHLHEVAMSDSCSPTNSSFLKNFVLPHPDVMPEAWRIGDKDGRLIVLWGYTSNASDATFLPLSSTSKNWKDATKRKDVATLLAPYSTAFSIAWKRLGIIAGIILLAVILFAMCGKKGDPPVTPDTVTPPIEAVMQDAQIPDNVKVIYQQAADANATEADRDEAIRVYDERQKAGQTTQSENTLVEHLKDTPKVHEEPISSPDKLKESYRRTDTLKKEREGYAKKADELNSQAQTAEQKNREQNEKDEQTIRQTVSDIQKDTTVPEASKKIYEKCTEDEESRDKAIETIKKREEEGTATTKESELKKQLENQSANETKQLEEKKELDKAISDNEKNIQKVDDELRKEEDRRYDYAKEHGNEVEKLPTEQKKDLKALLKHCPVCHQDAVAYTMKYVGSNLDNANYYHFTLRLEPSCKVISDLMVSSFKVDSIFQRDNIFDPATRTITFKLKESEINSGDLKVVTEVEARHNGASVKTTVPLTLNVGAKRTYKNFEITIKK